MCKSTGYTEEEDRFKGLGITLDPENFDMIKDKYIPDVLKKGRIDLTLPVVNKNGKKSVHSINAFTVASQNGEIGIGATITDVADLISMQQELISAKEQAEYYNKAKNDFISRMSHEMRTPMNGIIGMADLAKIAEDDERRKFCLRRIRESAHDLLDIINNILDWVKFEHKSYSLTAEECSLSSVLKSLAELTSSYTEVKKQNFTLNTASDLPDLILADEAGLKQALTNILGNAVKFTPEGGSINFSVSADKQNDTVMLCFEIKDTGIGITDELMSRLFTPFEQGNNGISRTYYGVGLGLPISKRIIEKMGGEIRVESEPGKGSVFTCIIPVELPAVQSNTTPEEDNLSFTNQRFLIVDDVELNRDILEAMLEETGVQIDCAVNGADALAKFTEKNGAYDFVLMDLHMPEMDGFEASRRIRASGLPGAAGVPIIAVTADTGGEVIAKCIEAGMDDHIGKPINFMLLTGMINRYILRKKMNDSGNVSLWAQGEERSFTGGSINCA
ncbi:ATP-binding protein [Leadbettera azotonutricia]|nr:ATP-binding protein [Leadbettera azotonutricia]